VIRLATIFILQSCSGCLPSAQNTGGSMRPNGLGSSDRHGNLFEVHIAIARLRALMSHQLKGESLANRVPRSDADQLSLAF
jgi:hypothetical protein